MNVGICFFQNSSRPQIFSFHGFILGGYANAKTDTDQFILSATSSTFITVTPFSGEPYFPSAPLRVDAMDYESNGRTFVLGTRTSSVTPYSVNGSTVWRTGISHPFNMISGFCAGQVTAGLINGFLAFGSSGGIDSTDLIRYADSSSMSSGWNTVTHPTMTAVIGLATNGAGGWVATGTNGTGTSSSILWSTNGGQIFNDISGGPTFTSGGYAVAYGKWHNGVSNSPAWVVGGLDPTAPLKFTFTADGSSGWTAEPALIINIVAIATNGAARWVVVGQNSQDVYYSGDYGASWALANLNVGTDLYYGISVAYGVLNGTPTWILTGASAGTTKTRYSTTNGSSWSDPTFVAPATEFAGTGSFGGTIVKYIT